MQHSTGSSRYAVLVLVLVVFGGITAPPVEGQDESKTATERWLSTHQNPTQKQYFGEPVSLSLKDADLVEVLRSFAEIGDFNLVLQPGIQGTVTVELKDIPWDQALEQILKINGLGMDITGGQVHVGPGSTFRGSRSSSSQTMVTVRLPLQYADATVVARALHRPESGLPNPGGSIKAQAAGNQLILHDRRATLHELGRVLTAIDVPTAADEDPKDLEQRCIDQWQRIVSESTSSP